MSADVLRRAADRLDGSRVTGIDCRDPWDEPLAAWLRRVADDMSLRHVADYNGPGWDEAEAVARAVLKATP